MAVGLRSSGLQLFFLALLAVSVSVVDLVAEKRESTADDSIIYKKFYVDSLIVSRYAVTTITGVVRNEAESAKEIDFLVQLPANAFISNFTMLDL